MKYDLPIQPELSKAVFSIGRFDAEFAGDGRAFNKLLDYLANQVKDKAIIVCTEKFKGDDESKAYDRGYVKGLHEVIKFLRMSYDKGEKIMYPEENKRRIPRSV